MKSVLVGKQLQMIPDDYCDHLVVTSARESRSVIYATDLCNHLDVYRSFDHDYPNDQRLKGLWAQAYRRMCHSRVERMQR